jgi:hypothetical protein
VDRVAGFLDRVEDVCLRQLPPLSTLLVWTSNSLYRIVVTEAPSVYVQGGQFFSDPTSARLGGASNGGGFLRVGCIGVGLRMEIHAGGKRIVTSPVRAIATERPATGLVH